MDQLDVNGINGKQSSTPVTRPARKSLAGIRKNTVSGMVNRFTQMIELPKDIAARKAEFCEVSEIDIDSTTLNFGDSGYDSLRHRSQSVDICSAIDQSKSVLVKYAKFPNFKFSYLKYFGVDPTEYLSTFGIDYDAVSDSVCNDSSVLKVSGGDSVVANNVEFDLRESAQTMNSKKRTFDSSLAKVSNPKYLAMDPNQMQNNPVKVVPYVECTDFEDLFSTKATVSRDTHTPEPALESVVVSAPDKISPQRPLEDRRNGVVETDLKSSVQESIQSFDNMMKALRNGGSRKRKCSRSEDQNKRVRQ